MQSEAGRKRYGESKRTAPPVLVNDRSSTTVPSNFDLPHEGWARWLHRRVPPQGPTPPNYWFNPNTVERLDWKVRVEH